MYILSGGFVIRLNPTVIISLSTHGLMALPKSPKLAGRLSYKKCPLLWEFIQYILMYFWFNSSVFIIFVLMFSLLRPSYSYTHKLQLYVDISTSRLPSHDLFVFWIQITKQQPESVIVVQDLRRSECLQPAVQYHPSVQSSHPTAYNKSC